MGIDNSDSDMFKISYGVFANNDILKLNTSLDAIFMGGLSIGGGAVTHDELNVYSSGTKMGGLWGTGSGGYGKFNLRDNGTEKLLLSAGSDSYFNGGDVAIGTSSPDHKFHVSGSIASNTTEEVCRIEGGTWVNSGGITIKATGASTGATRLTTIFSIDNQDQDSPLAFGTGTTERMRITSTGLVGIAVDNPEATLQIGEIPQSGGSTTTAASLAHFVGSTAPSTVNGFATLKLEYPAGHAPSTAGAQIMFTQGYHSGDTDNTCLLYTSPSPRDQA